MSPAQAIKKKKYTYEDYTKTPNDIKYELIEGDLIMTPAPITKHQRISRKLEFYIEKHVMENNLGEVFDAPYDVHLDDENVLQPDILFVSKERLSIINEKNINGAPDLTIEILSESSAYRDVIQKKKLYARFGVKEYWIVAGDDKLIEVYQLKHKDEYKLNKTYYENDILESHVIKGLKIDLKNIF